MVHTVINTWSIRNTQGLGTVIAEYRLSVHLKEKWLGCQEGLVSTSLLLAHVCGAVTRILFTGVCWED